MAKAKSKEGWLRWSLVKLHMVAFDGHTHALQARSHTFLCAQGWPRTRLFREQTDQL